MPLILIADDDEAYCAILADCLQTEGYEVEAVSDAGQLESRMATRGFHAAILDMQMPLGGGVVAAKHIRARYANIVIPIIVCSGMPADMTRAWFEGVPKLSVFQKPLDFRKLLDELARLLSQP